MFGSKLGAIAAVGTSHTYLRRSLLSPILSLCSPHLLVAPLSGITRFQGRRRYLLLVHPLLVLQRDRLRSALLPLEQGGHRPDTGLSSICSSRRTRLRYFL